VRIDASSLRLVVSSRMACPLLACCLRPPHDHGVRVCPPAALLGTWVATAVRTSSAGWRAPPAGEHAQDCGARTGDGVNKSLCTCPPRHRRSLGLSGYPPAALWWERACHSLPTVLKNTMRRL